MQHSNILVIGGAGFIGRHIVARLTARGLRVTVPTRRRARARDLILLPTIDVVECDVHDEAVLSNLVRNKDAVINLIGVLHSSQGSPYGREFAASHVELPRRIVAACRTHGVDRLLHMSALGADSKGPSMYQRSKGDGDAVVQASPLDWTIFRPSVVFGPEDNFLNLFATLAKFFPVLPIGGADARFQPVWVGDVADAFVNALDQRATFRRIYELAGPQVYQLRELVAFAASASGHPRPVIGLPAALARVQAMLMEILPGEPLMSRDNLDSMKVDNVAAEQPFRPAPELAIQMTPLEAEAPAYLARTHARSRFGLYRARAGR
ncbi:MAG: complex I NDUFA9 subunit family protein [Pseudomonadota bacterium]|nr:complex I NDUFA9 subunit family protein [Burkholderiaceae bacterium]MDQ3445753.1 complex I NDUFA9 subunit family protein [Pseudomonadota bacterium]